MGLQHPLTRGLRPEETFRRRSTHPPTSHDGQTSAQNRYLYVPSVQGPVQIWYTLNYRSLNELRNADGTAQQLITRPVD